MIVILSCYFLIEKSITPCDMELFFSFLWLWVYDVDWNRKLTETDQNRNTTETDGFSTISVGFGWEFHKPKISVLVGRIKKTDQPNRLQPYRAWAHKKGPFGVIRAFSSKVLKMLNAKCYFLTFLTPQIIKIHLYQACQILKILATCYSEVLLLTP